MASQRAALGEALRGPRAAKRFLSSLFATADPARETLFVVHVAQDRTCLHLSRFDGREGAVHLPIRAIIGDAARLGSDALLLAHNHPSGDTTPSEADRRATRRLALASDAMDVDLLDHFVFGPGGHCCSFRDLGLL